MVALLLLKVTVFLAAACPQEFWPRLTGLKWLHSCSAGLEHLLFPELISSNVILTNAKGVYSHSLAE
jgi:phosphoglycerate dehydrogenase-like enzyme